MRNIRLPLAIAAALLLASCNAMLVMVYPNQTTNSVDLAVTTNDSYITPSNASTLQVFASVYYTGDSYPVATYDSGLSYNTQSGSYTADISFGGLSDATYYVLVWLDENGNGTWDNGEPYYLSSNFTLYGVQTLNMPVTVP